MEGAAKLLVEPGPPGTALKTCTKCKEPHNKGRYDPSVQREWRTANLERSRQTQRNWREANCERARARDRAYSKTPTRRKYLRAWQKDAISTDVQVKIGRNLRSRLSTALGSDRKTGSAVRDLGCTIVELRVWLEAKFYPHPVTGEAMSWENYGLYGWHVDHKRPLVSFDLADRAQLCEACHFTNLQPLWARDNLKKGAKA